MLMFLIEDETSASNKKYDLILSIGGDGIFLSASKYAYKNTIPILGLNFGRIGFLVDLDKKDLKVKIKNVIDGNYIIDKRILLSGTDIKKQKFKSISSK